VQATVVRARRGRYNGFAFPPWSLACRSGIAAVKQPARSGRVAPVADAECAAAPCHRVVAPCGRLVSTATATTGRTPPAG